MTERLDKITNRIATALKRPLSVALTLGFLGTTGVATGLVAGLAILPASAQSGSPFRTVVRVNDSVITQFEVDQRLDFMTLLRAPGATLPEVYEELIDDRLKMEAVRRVGAEVSPDQLLLAMEEFAGRADLSLEEFVSVLNESGVDPQTFRDFVEVGASWSNFMRGRFSSSARVSESELDRALALGTGSGNVQVLLSEIVLPLTPQTAGLSRQQAEAIGRMTSIDEFAAAARQVSIAPSAAEDGRLAWLPLSQLPAQIAPIFLTLAPGEVSPPVPLPNGQALALFQLRSLQDGRPSLTRDVNLEYMILRLGAPNAAAAELARITPLVDTCDSLFGLYPGSDETRLEVVTTTRSKSGNLASVIDTLDPNEMAALPGGAAIVMLCERTALLGEDLSRDDLQQRLFVRKLEDLADGFLSELRANAFIER